MRVAPGLIQPSILLASDRADSVAFFRRIFNAVSWPLLTARTIEQAMQTAETALPHIIIADSRLPDGHVQALADRLRGQANLRRVPVVVNIIDERTADRLALGNRRYAGFFAGEPQPKACMMMLRQVTEAQLRPSPYFVFANRLTEDPAVRLDLSAKVLGSYETFVVLLAPLKIAANARVELLTAGTSVKIDPSDVISRRHEGGGFLNFLPRKGLSGDAPALLAKLTALAITQGGKPVQLGAPRDRRVLVYHPDPERGRRFLATLDKHGISVVYVRELQQATKRVHAEPEGYGCVFLYDLLHEPLRKDWTSMYNEMPLGVRPGLVIGTQAAAPASSEQVVFLRRPLELPDLLRAVDTMLEGAAIRQGPLAVAVKAGVALTTTVSISAALTGLDEQGGIVEVHGRIVAGVGGMLTASGLSKLWPGPQLISVEGGGMAPTRPFVWQQRFTLKGHDDRPAQVKALAALSQVAAETHGEEDAQGDPAEAPVAPSGSAKASKANAYDAKVINFFIQSCYEVIEYYCGELPQLGKPFLKGTKPLPDGFVSGTSAVSGRMVRGSTKLACERSFVALLADRVTGTPPYDAARDDGLLAEVLTELCDQIFGKARVLLETAGYEYEVGLPEVLMTPAADSAEATAAHVLAAASGDGMAPAPAQGHEPAGGTPVMIIPFALHAAKFLVEVCFEQV